MRQRNQHIATGGRRMPRPCRTAAFTLLEMMVATMLAVVLMTAVISVLRGFEARRKLAEAAEARHPATALLAGQLRRDVLSARYVQRDGRSLRLVGNMAADWNTGVPNGRLAQVVYRVEAVGNVPWLWREETHLDETTTERRRRQPVWCGAARIELVELEQPLPGDVGQPDRPELAIAVGMQAMAPRVAVVLWDRNGKPLLQVPVQHHWE